MGRLKRIVVSISNQLLEEAVTASLAQTGEFRPERVALERTTDIARICSAIEANILLMGVSRVDGFTFDDRMRTLEEIRASSPLCKVVFLCDEKENPLLARQVKSAKQEGILDAFFFDSVSSSYLVAALEAL